MRILFVSPSTDPFTNLEYGASQRTCMLLRACAQAGPTDVCSFADADVKEEDAPANCRLVHSKHVTAADAIYMPLASRYSALIGKTDLAKIYRRNEQMSAIVHDLMSKGDYDLVVVRYLSNAVMCGLTDFMDRLVIDIDDDPVKSHLMRISLKGGHRFLGKAFDSLKVLPDRIAMNHVQRNCRGTFYSNPEEAVHPNSAALPNVPVRHMAADAGTGAGKGLLFIGSLNYLPNALGISRFVEEVWPRVLLEDGDARLRIAGICDDASRITRWNSVKGVDYIGYAQSAEDEYRKCRLVIAPIYHGTGTNIKVLEAMSMGRVCVTTPTGIRGFSQFLNDGENIVVAADDEAFARRVSVLLGDPDECARIAQNARETIAQHFSTESFIQTASSFISRL